MLFGLLRRVPGNLVLVLTVIIFLAFYFNPGRLSELNEVYLNHTRIHHKILNPTSRTRPVIPPLSEITSLTSACEGVRTIIKSFTQTQNIVTTELAASTTTITASAKCPTQDPISFNAPKNNIHFTPEQETVAKLRQEGIIIIFKTGAQEVSNLAIQVGTTLRYLDSQDILFFSDQAGSIGPFIIHDALRNVDQKIRQEDEDFKIYRDIKRYQTTGQDIEELKEEKGKGDDRAGWKLDKYKFMHMVEQSFEMRGDARWYVFIETDSYVLLSNLVSWLRTLDSTKALYLGSPVMIGDSVFAHGGSGYVLSNAAMNKLLGPEQPQGLAASWDMQMKRQCCGDLALGIAMKEKGIRLLNAQPYTNGEKPTSFAYGPGELWCQASVVMHHVLPHEVSAIWRFERKRELLFGKVNGTTFEDMYHHFVEPHLVKERDNWDNLSRGSMYSRKAFGEDEERIKKANEEVEREMDSRRKKEEEEKKQEEERKQEEKKKEEDKRKEAETTEGTSIESNDEAQEKEMKRKDNKGNETNNSISPSEEPKKEEETINNLQYPPSPSLLQAPTPTTKRLVKRSEEEDKSTFAHQESFKSFENCGKACEQLQECFQFLYSEESGDQICRLGTYFRLGKYVASSVEGRVEWKSGWLVDRIREWTEQNPCVEVEWPQ